jgi:hypothetical protein
MHKAHDALYADAEKCKYPYKIDFVGVVERIGKFVGILQAIVDKRERSHFLDVAMKRYKEMGVKQAQSMFFINVDDFKVI